MKQLFYISVCVFSISSSYAMSYRTQYFQIDPNDEYAVKFFDKKEEMAAYLNLHAQGKQSEFNTIVSDKLAEYNHDALARLAIKIAAIEYANKYHLNENLDTDPELDALRNARISTYSFRPYMTPPPPYGYGDPRHADPRPIRWVPVRGAVKKVSAEEPPSI